MHITELTYQILSILGAPKIHTNLLWDLTLLFLIIGVAYFFFVFFFRNKLSKRDVIIRGKRKELAPIISSFLFHSPENPKEEQKEYVELKIKIREYLGDKKFRRIVNQILFDLQKDVAGGTRERLFRLYRELELHHDAFQKLKSWRWETVAKGILELSQMEVPESYLPIRKFINDRRSVIRKQAELATVVLRSDGIDYILDMAEHSISEWQQIKLIETLGKRKNYKPPQFKGWLLSQNKDVVLFTLRLIKYYNQKGAEPSINELIKHKNDEIKIAAIQCIIDFRFESAIDVLKLVFEGTSNTVKINILNAIASLGSEADIPFLQKVAARASSFIIVSKAQSAINTIAPETILPSKDIMNLDGTNVREDIEEEIAINQPETDENQSPTVEEPIDFIEVDDIECFDEVEFPSSDIEKKVVEPFVPAFELSPMDEEFENSLNDAMGLVTSDKEKIAPEDVDPDDNDKTDAPSHWAKAIDNTSYTEELPILEDITESEGDSESRFHAFKAIQSIHQSIEEYDGFELEASEKILPPEQQSIFYELYHHTDDTEAKLILLQELMAIADKRDVPFLNSLLSEEDRIISDYAKDAISSLSEDESNFNQKESVETTDAVDEPKEKPVVDTDKRIPMELFLLYEELGLKSSEKPEVQPSPFDFELSEEFFSELSNDVVNQIEINE